MHSSEQRPAEPADLGRLRIDRDEGPARVGGFPWLRTTLAVGLAALIFLARDPLLALFEGGAGTPVQTIRAERVVPGQAEAGDVAANGYIIADVQASLASVISGRLVELAAKEGDEVEKDQVVARIQYDDLEVQEAQAHARRLSAEARVGEARSGQAAAFARVRQAKKEMDADVLVSARLTAEIEAQVEVVRQARETQARLAREVERNRKLRKDRFIDEGTWDKVQTEARTATMALEAAEAQQRALGAGRAAWAGQIARREAAWQVAQKNDETAAATVRVAEAAVGEAREAERFAAILLEKTRIRAPFSGRVIRKDAEVGEVIAPTGAGNSRGSVLTIVDPDSFEVQVELSERRIARVNEGDHALVFLDADPERGLAGRVRKIWPRADRSKGSIELRVTLDHRPADLRPEMAARVVFKGHAAPTGDLQARILLPVDAIATRKGGRVVFVVEQGHVRAVPVQVGAREGDRIEIAQGLSGGEVVVRRPARGLADGDAVTAKD